MEGEGIDPTDAPMTLAVIDCHDDVRDQLGLSLTEGQELLAAAQSVLVSGHAPSWVTTQDYCHSCYTPLRHKDSRAIVIRTVFGKVAINSPRFWSCDCEQTSDCQSRTISSLSQALSKRVTPELECLQTKWAAHLAYGAATAMLKELLPLENSISASGSRHRIRATGDAMDRQIEQEIARTAVLGEVEHPRESERITAVSVDLAWLKHCNPSWGYGRQVNIAAGRAILADGSSKVYAYVGKRVRSGAARLDHFLTQSGVRWEERVEIISDGASEFTTAVEGSQFARGSHTGLVSHRDEV